MPEPKLADDIDWSERLKDRSIAYDGSEVSTPLRLTFEQIESGLPPVGVAASSNSLVRPWRVIALVFGVIKLVEHWGHVFRVPQRNVLLRIGPEHAVCERAR